MTERIIEARPNSPERREVHPALKFALELGPLVVFFLGNSRGEWLVGKFPALLALGGPLFVATALFMAATIAALAVSWALTRTLPIMPLVSGVFVLVFGGLTLWLQNETFIKMKPTIVNSLFAAILLGGLFLFNRPLLGYVFDQAFKLDDAGWRKLTFRWGLFFIVMAMLNEIVWRGARGYYFPDAKAADEFWAGFKLFGTMPITMAFMLFQVPLLKRHALAEDGGSRDRQN